MEHTQECSRVFGPVPSRRLGRSLGVDLVPYKTCSYDCIYCQLGPTTCRTIERKKYVPFDTAIGQVEHRLRQTGAVDYITLSGSGEPTLHARLGEVIQRIKKITDIPVAVLTNGSLLWMERVREELAGADLVIPSLDAGDDAVFQYVNRPHRSISFEGMVDGIRRFRKEFRGRMWLEVLLLGGISATRAGAESIAAHARTIGADRVQLNTVLRPPRDRSARRVAKERMLGLAQMFEGAVEVIADYENVHDQSDYAVSRNEVLALLERRPCTVDDVSAGLSIHRNEAIKHLQHLTEENTVSMRTEGDLTFYVA